MLDADQLLIKAAIEVRKPVGVQAHLVQNRGMQAFDMERFFDRCRPQFIGRPH